MECHKFTSKQKIKNNVNSIFIKNVTETDPKKIVNEFNN